METLPPPPSASDGSFMREEKVASDGGIGIITYIEDDPYGY